MDILEQARQELDNICTEQGLDRSEMICVRQLSPDEAIGKGADADFVIKKGKERVIDACFREARGQAFTDAPIDWQGPLSELWTLDLGDSSQRAVVTAGLNAVLRHLEMADGTVHCLDDEPTKCGDEMTDRLKKRFGICRYGLIGLQPAILKGMTKVYGAELVRVLDLNPDNIGKSREGVAIMDGEKDLAEFVKWCDVGLATGSSMVNGSINGIMSEFTAIGKPLVFFGNTISGVASLMKLDRICPFAH